MPTSVRSPLSTCRWKSPGGRGSPSVGARPIRVGDGSLRWDWPRIVSEVETGLERGLATGAVASIGVDGWGVDYGLIDRSGIWSPSRTPTGTRGPDGWRRLPTESGSNISTSSPVSRSWGSTPSSNWRRTTPGSSTMPHGSSSSPISSSIISPGSRPRSGPMPPRRRSWTYGPATGPPTCSTNCRWTRRCSLP